MFASSCKLWAGDTGGSGSKLPPLTLCISTPVSTRSELPLCHPDVSVDRIRATTSPPSHPNGGVNWFYRCLPSSPSRTQVGRILLQSEVSKCILWSEVERGRVQSELSSAKGSRNYEKQS